MHLFTVLAFSLFASDDPSYSYTPPLLPFSDTSYSYSPSWNDSNIVASSYDPVTDFTYSYEPYNEGSHYYLDNICPGTFSGVYMREYGPDCTNLTFCAVQMCRLMEGKCNTSMVKLRNASGSEFHFVCNESCDASPC